MISTTDLTGTQLVQLEALLADTTPGGGVFRPPVAVDDEALRVLVDAGLAYRLQDVLFDHYEVTDAGRAIVVERARDAADTEVFALYATDDELRAAIEALKVVFNDLTDPLLRDRALLDIEACQNALDDRDDRAEGRSASTGRHRLVPVDDRPTQVIPPVQEQTAPMATLPGVPVILREQPDHLDPDSAERMWAALKGNDTGQDVYDELAAETTDEWAALEADLADESSWWQRNVTDRLNPRRKFVLAIVATVVVTWFAAWLVMA